MSLNFVTEGRFSGLEQRVRQIEEKLQINVEPPSPESPAQSAVKPPPPVSDAAVPPTPAASVVEPVIVAPPRKVEPFRAIAPEPLQSLSYKAPPPIKPIESNPFEQTLGLKWAGWVGAVVLIIGGVLGVKFVYDNGWFTVVPAWLRLLGIFAAGFSLIGAGEWVLRKVHPVPAACLFGVGVAALFVAGYTGNAYFELYSVATAQAAMIFATVVGAAIAVRANLVSIGVLALVGGNVAPLIVGRRDASVESFLIYLLMLQLVALLLAAWGRGGKWWTLRGLSLGTTSLWIGTLLSSGAHSAWLPIAMLIAAAGYQIELVYTIRRRAEVKPFERQTGAIFSYFLVAAATAGGLIYFADFGRTWQTAWTLLLAGACGVQGAVLPRLGEQFKVLAKSYRVAAVALLGLAVPVALAGDSLLIGWAMLAVVLAGVQRGKRSPLARIAAAATWYAGMAYAGILLAERFTDSFDNLTHALGVGLVDFHFASRWAGSAFIAAAGFVVARLISNDKPAKPQPDVTWKALAESIAAVATLSLVLIVWLEASAAVGAMTLIVMAWFLLAAQRPLQPLAIARRVMVLLLAALARVAWSDVAIHFFGRHTVPVAPILNPSFMLYGGIAASLAAVYRWTGDGLANGEGRAALRERFVLGIAGVIAWALSVEVIRSVASLHRPMVEAWHLQSLLLSTVWLGCAMTTQLVLHAFSSANGSARTASKAVAALVILASMKYVAIDALGWRAFHVPLTDAFSQFAEMVSATVLVALAYGMSVRREQSGRTTHNEFILLAAVMTVFAGSMQLDRAILGTPAWLSFSDPRLALMVSLSVLWAVCAVAAVIAGFAKHSAALRYFGLGLLGVTLLKVVLLDLQAAGTGYRIISFIALGAVMIGTSIVYGKISPLLKERDAVAAT